MAVGGVVVVVGLSKVVGLRLVGEMVVAVAVVEAVGLSRVAGVGLRIGLAEEAAVVIES